MHPRNDQKPPPIGRAGAVFAVSVVTLVAASGFAGAMLRPIWERIRGPRLPAGGELASFLEHASVDVRRGRAAHLVEPLRGLAAQAKDPATRERVLGLWTEAALQAGRLEDAAASEEQREALAGAQEKSAIRLRRIGLAGALGRSEEAARLAEPMVKGDDSRLADEARLRLVATKGEKDLRAWVESRTGEDPEEARRAGMAALRLLGDAERAERLLAPLEKGGRCDASLCEALADAYGRLDRPADLARVLAVLLEPGRVQDESERARMALARAAALGRSGDVRGALSAVEAVRRSPDFEARQAARRARYELLRQAGLLRAEVASLRDPAERAFVALEIDRNYAEAVRLYAAASQPRPDSLELAQGLREAERRRELAERRALYEQVLSKEPDDQPTREKHLATLVALGEADEARRWVSRALQGRESSAEGLVAAALALRKAGLDRDAASALEKAHAAERDPARKQQILFALGDLYSAARQDEAARRLYANLAAEGASPEIRERAVARLAALLR